MSGASKKILIEETTDNTGASQRVAATNALMVTGTKSVGQVPKVQSDETVAWDDESGGGGTVPSEAKTTPVDADVVTLWDSAAAFARKKITWANVKAALLAYLRGVFSNPNILINTDGTDPINQRGIADTDALSTGDYTVDRWYVTHDCTSVTFENSNGGSGIILTDVTSGTSAEYAQKVEGFAEYQGKEITLSMEVSSDNACTIFIDDGVGTTSSSAHSGSGTETLTVTCTIDGSASKLEVGISLVISANNWAEFNWAKLEEGSVATPHTIPDPAIELGRCKRYYQRINAHGAYSPFAVGLCTSTTNASVNMDHSILRSTAWTLGYANNFALSDGVTLTAVTSLSLQYRSDGKTSISAVTAGGLTQHRSCTLVANNDTTAYIELLDRL